MLVKTNGDLAAYVEMVRGQFIDVDGVFGAQCWDQWSHYAQWLGVPAWPTYTNAGGYNPHPGWACNVHHNSWEAGLNQWFEILPAQATPRVGDVAFWELGSPWFPSSHVATVLAVTHGGRMLRCLTQNPGAVQIADLIIDGIIGYLRPRNLVIGDVDDSKTPTIPASEKRDPEEDDMAKNIGTYYTRKPDGIDVYVVSNTISGYRHEFNGAKDRPLDAGYLRDLAAAYDIAGGAWRKTTEAEASAHRVGLDRVRAGVVK